MSKPDTENEPPAGPGPVVKAALRGIDACLNALQNLRNRLAGAQDHESHDSGRGRADPKQDKADGEALPTRPSLLRRVAIALILLIVGGATGAVLSYRTLSHQLKAHTAVVERIQEELDADRKESARNLKLLDKVQRENAEYRQEAREAEREAEKHKRRADELEAQVEEARRAEEAKRTEERKRAEVAAQQAKRAAAPPPRSQPRTPPKTGNCAAGTAAEMAECLEKFNRP
jgi:flagellar biosynthesis GTPase FlhF